MSGTQALADWLVAHDPEGATRILESAAPADAAAAVADSAPDVLARLVRTMAPVPASELFAALPEATRVAVIQALPFDAAHPLLRRVTQEVRRSVLGGLSMRAKTAFESVLRYPTGSAGALMSPLGFCVAPEMTVGEVLSRIRASGEPVGGEAYVTGANQVLEGVAAVVDLVRAEPTRKVGEVARKDVVTLPPEATRSVVAQHPAWASHEAMPVVDRRGVWRGVVERRARAGGPDGAAGRGERSDYATTAAALGEVYGVGVAALLGWASGTKTGAAS